jgi:hypothetical protein
LDDGLRVPDHNGNLFAASAVSWSVALELDENKTWLSTVAYSNPSRERTSNNANPRSRLIADGRHRTPLGDVAHWIGRVLLAGTFVFSMVSCLLERVPLTAGTRETASIGSVDLVRKHAAD